MPGLSISLARGLLDSATTGIVLADARVRGFPLVYVNDAFQRITGYSAGEAVGRNCRFLQTEGTDEETLASLRAHCGRVSSRFMSCSTGARTAARFGTNCGCVRCTRADGELTHFAGIQNDVTAREMATREVARLAGYNQLLLESTGEGIYNIGADGSCQFINRAAAAMLGYDVSDLVGADLHGLLHHSHEDGSPYPSDECPTYQVFRTGAGVTVEDEVFWRSDGRPLPVQYSSYPVWDKGRIEGAVVVFSDVSVRRRAESELRAAMAATEEATRAKTTLLANMSHELRTPLNAVIGYAELAAEKAADIEAESIIADLEKIVTAGRLLLSLINQLLDISKIEAGRMELDVSQFTLREVVEEAVDTLRPAAEAAHLSLTARLADGDRRLRGDRGKLTQILLNILSNAVKFTGEGAVTVSGRISAADIIIDISDTGIGMTSDHLERVFEPFEQADVSTTRRFGGTGLGLAICRSLCRLMGGDITLRSAVGEGSTFTVRLPVDVTRPSAVDVADETEPVEPRSPRPRGSRPRKPADPDAVLVIDDNPVDRDLLARHLESAGFVVHTASTGAAGIQRAREVQPAAILVDVLMPDQNGWQVLVALRSDPDLAEVPVVMATILDQRSLAMSLGATEYFTKPVDWSRLTTLLAEYRRQAGETAPRSDQPRP